MIKFGDLGVTNERAIHAVTNVMRSGRFINGPNNAAFEKVWAQECQADSCVLTASGSAALIAVMTQLHTTRATKVVIPALSFAATAFAVKEAGCTPVFVDVDEHGLMRWDQVEDYLRVQYKQEVLAVIPVHLYGQLLSIPPAISDMAIIIQDACQAHGLIDMSDGPGVACFSFYPAKNLGAIGDAGAVVFKDMAGLERRVRCYINYGDEPGEKYVHSIQGNNLRCDEIQSAYLLEAYKDFYEAQNERVWLAKIYADLGIQSFARFIPNNWHLYPILVEQPERFRRLLRDYNIETGNHYPYILSGISSGYIPYKPTYAQYIANHVVTLPLHPRLTPEDVKYVADTVRTTCEFDGKLWIIKD